MFGSTALTAEQRLEKATIAITAKFPALAGVMMVGNKSVVDELGACTTAATNGRDEFYIRSFVDELSDNTLRAVMIHEVYHKMYSHLTTWKHLWEEDKQLANIACDHVINLQIDAFVPHEFAKLPDWVCKDTKFKGMDSAKVFALLKQEQEEGGGSGGGGKAMDDHLWEEAKDMTPEQVKTLQREIDSALRQGALAAGKMNPDGSDINLDDLLDVQVDWREVLREFVTTVTAGKDYSTWARPNRRYMAQGIYLPTGLTTKVGELLLAIDTSYSVSAKELTAIMSEIKGICDQVGATSIRLLYWGTEVTGDELYGDMGKPIAELVSVTKPKRGGGTSPSCVTKYIRDNNIKAEAAIVLTDGEVGNDFGGRWDLPLLWCFTNDHSPKPPVGKCVVVKV